MGYSVMICDDNTAVHESLRCYLEPENIEVISVYDGETAISFLKTQTVDILILDVMLPGIDGYEVCHEIRKFSDVYIIMISAKGEPIERIIGLEAGADDYMPKPFSPHEVNIKIKKVLRRQYPDVTSKTLSVAELTIYPDSYEVFVNNTPVKMTSKEVELLIFMAANEGKVLSRERLLDAVWGYSYLGDIRVVDSLIKRVRQKLAFDNIHFAIKSIYGAGYKMVKEND